MSWYKKANKLTLQVSSYSKDTEILKVILNGVSYAFYGVNPFWKNKIEWMIEKSSIPHNVIYQKYLKNFSDPERHQELNPPQEQIEQPIEEAPKKQTQPTFWDL